MRIVEKVIEYNRYLLSQPDDVRKQLLDDLAKKGRKAIFEGLKSKDWCEFMDKFADTKEQLDRLTGKDKAFNETMWGMQCLAYMASNSTCTSDTITGTGTLRNMPIDMVLALDRDLPEQQTPKPANPCG